MSNNFIIWSFNIKTISTISITDDKFECVILQIVLSHTVSSKFKNLFLNSTYAYKTQ